MKIRRITAVVFAILAAAWAGVLFFFSGQSGVDSSSLSLGLARIIVGWFPALGGPADFEPILRKLAHFGIFAIEGFLTGVSLICALGSIKGAVLAAMLCAVMAVANEYHQTFAENRFCSVSDMLIDSGGALLGVIVSAAVIASFEGAYRARQRKKRRLSGNAK